MHKIEIVNLKCGGCEATIKKELEKIGMKNVVVNHENKQVQFEGSLDSARESLVKLGYPEVGSVEAKSLIKKAKSYASCIRGKFNKK